VWFDAPIGYISITANLLQENYKAWWQNNKDVKLYQFMGKDNVPFHTIMFPSSLIASKQGWTLLHHISTTEFLNYENGKFSKTHNTGVFGDNAI
jgi:methionyl-tRNA synthetase